ncbi:MAG: glycosyltransferase [Aeromicrobium sp.]|nr:MAG: glycosyltransferase [Aeromicrobium sp.]
MTHDRGTAVVQAHIQKTRLATEPGPRRVLIITGDPIGKKLAGPAIRALSFAAELAEDGHSVRVVSLQHVEISDARYELLAVSTQQQMIRQEDWAEIIVVQGNALVLYPVLANTKKYLVVDIYDPMHLEQLEQSKGLGPKDWNQAVSGANGILNHQLRIGDFFLAASDRQVQFWLGALATLGRVNPLTYGQDDSLRSLIDIASFGLDGSLPEVRRPALRNVVPGIDDSSKILIWAGGIYDWFDPITLVYAVNEVRKSRPEVCLYFMGTRHPHPGVPEMDIIAETRQVSKSLGLTGKNVFFNDSWVDYKDRHNFLLESDAGVSTHFEHVETQFSFRTRILDYLWAGLPIITTNGDVFAELVTQHKLGASVPDRNVDSLAKAIDHVLFDGAEHIKMRANVLKVREQFTWRNTTAALRKFCESPWYAADRIMVDRHGEIHRAPTSQSRFVLIRRIRRAFDILVSQGPVALIRAVRRSSR